MKQKININKRNKNKKKKYIFLFTLLILSVVIIIVIGLITLQKVWYYELIQYTHTRYLLSFLSSIEL